MLFAAFTLAEILLLCDQHKRTTAQLQICNKRGNDIPKTELNTCVQFLQRRVQQLYLKQSAMFNRRLGNATYTVSKLKESTTVTTTIFGCYCHFQTQHSLRSTKKSTSASVLVIRLCPLLKLLLQQCRQHCNVLRLVTVAVQVRV